MSTSRFVPMTGRFAKSVDAIGRVKRMKLTLSLRGSVKTIELNYIASISATICLNNPSYELLSGEN